VGYAESMKVEEFCSDNTESCLEIFDSNLGLYFDYSERDEFLYFLNIFGESDHYYIFNTEGKIVACGGYSHKDEFALLTWGMVARQIHGKGLGTTIVEYRIGKILSDGLSNFVRIDTSQHTEHFYKKMGFTTVETDKNGFGKGIDRVTMEYSHGA